MRVVELSDSDAAAAYCGKIFARWGANVIKVERPGRDEPSLSLDLYLNGGKRRVALDYADADDRARLSRLAEQCDVLVTDAPAADVERFGLLELGGSSPRVHTSITPFGLSGPYRDHEATAATLLALGGHTHLMGDPDRAPLTMPGNYPYYQAANFAYVASMAAYLRAEREPDVAPQAVEVSVFECLASLHQFTDTMWTFGGETRSRHGNRWENIFPTGLMPCQDGWIAINMSPNFWHSFTVMIGRPEYAEDGHRFATAAGRFELRDELEDIMIDVFSTWPKQRLLLEGQGTWRVPFGYLASLGEMLDDPHLAERDFWRPLPGGATGDLPLRTAGSPFQFVGDEPPTEKGVWPPGAHTDEVPAAAAEQAGEPRSRGAGASPRVLEGLRIVDLTRIWSGPIATRVLADLGAEVIKVEAHLGRGPAILPPGMRDPLLRVTDGADPQAPVERRWNRQALFNKLNRNKQSIALNLKAAEGRDIFLRLVAESDVVIENFSARAMPGLDLGYDALRKANDQIIYVAMPAFGLRGPYREYVGLGPSIEPMTGLTALMGYSADEPRGTSKAVVDPVAGTAAASAVMAGLERRARTGQGAFIEVSQHESGIAFHGEQVLERQITDREPERLGNGHHSVAPYGVYRCRGDDEWIALAARDEREWAGLCDLAAAGWGTDPRFTRAASRLEHCTELDAAIEAWTATRDKLELMSDLQDRRIPAGAVLSAPEWMADRHLVERGYFAELDHPDAGRTRWDGAPVLINGRRGYEGWLPAPMLGEHNESVLGDILGFSEEEISGFYDRSVIVDRPPDRRN